MLDIKIIREKPEEIRARLATRNRGDEVHIDTLLTQDKKRRELLTLNETRKSERNAASKQIGGMMAKGEKAAAEELKAKMKGLSDLIAETDKEIADVEAKQEALLLQIYNVPHSSVPVGVDANDNPVVRQIGEKVVLPFKALTHWEIGEKKGMLNFQQATKISGSGFIVYRGAGARLERALLNYLLDLHTREHGYTEVATPFMVRRECMVGTGQLPKFEEDMYGLQGEDLFLVPTAEVPVTNLHREEILTEEQLPIHYAAYTPCFRREAGSAGKDTRGMIRVHQFDKVELVHIVKPEDSYAQLETLVGHAERVLTDLELNYRVITLCTGDLGFGAAKCYDIEVWAPGLQNWLEVSSCSNFEDFQARRMNLRYKDKSGKNTFCHTLNGSGTALARLYIALLETHQQADGSVKIPKKLQPYFGSDSI
ncbi:MAG: serine--tRNA ligase [Verrucomicrobia bacterium Tous-C9LFEB]|nr:MAG: serine--tRNA ligase [Verrucomicrobia bacterium Tous-C9LFEB]